MRIILMLIGAMVLSVVVSAQTPSSKPKEQEQKPADVLYDNIPITPLVLYKRPEVTLQRALKLMEDYIEKEKIDIAPYYLSEVKFIRAEPEKNQAAFWLILWFKAGESLPNDIHFLVTMDERVLRLPSL
jgi:hypothetical protein